MMEADRSIDDLCKVASSNIITQTKYWTTEREFKREKMLIKQNLPFVPLVIPPYKRLDK